MGDAAMHRASFPDPRSSIIISSVVALLGPVLSGAGQSGVRHVSVICQVNGRYVGHSSTGNNPPASAELRLREKLFQQPVPRFFIVSHDPVATDEGEWTAH